MYNLKGKMRKIVAEVLVIAVVAGTVPFSSLRVRATQIENERPIYSEVYHDMFENFTEEQVVMTRDQYEFRDKGAWSTSTDEETGAVSLTYNTAEGVQGTNYANVDAQFGYDLKGEVTDYCKNVAGKSLGSVLGSTWNVLQRYSDALTDLEKEDVFVYETNLRISSINANGFYFNFRVPDLQGAGDYWQSMRTGLLVTSNGFYLQMMNEIELAKYELDMSQYIDKDIHLTILSSPESVSVWLEDTLLFDDIEFVLPEANLEGNTYKNGSTVLPLNSTTNMIPNIGMFVADASKFTISNQHLYLYEKATSEWDANDRNYYDAEQITASSTISKGANWIDAPAQDSNIVIEQNLASDFQLEDTVITELEYTPTNITNSNTEDWTTITGIDVAFRSDGTSNGELKMKIRVQGEQTLLHFVDQHMGTDSLATVNVIEGQKIRLTIVHDAEKASVYFNGIALYTDIKYADIPNYAGNQVNTANMQPIFKVTMGYADWKLENISIRKDNDTSGLEGVTMLDATNNYMSTHGDIYSTLEGNGNWKEFADSTIQGNSIYTDLRWENLQTNGNADASTYWMCEKFYLFGNGNENTPIETNDSFVLSVVARVSNGQLSDGTNTYPARLATHVGSYDGEEAWYFIDRESGNTPVLSVLEGATIIESIDVGTLTGYEVGDYIRLTTAVSPFGYDIYMNGLKVYSYTAAENAVADYSGVCYEVSGAEVRLFDISVHKNSDNGSLYKEKIEEDARSLKYGLQGVYHEDKLSYIAMAEQALETCAAYDGTGYEALKQFVNIGKLYETVLADGKVVNNMVRDGNASVEESISFETTEGGTSWKWGGITLLENGCTMNQGETWLFEADVTCVESLEETNRIGFGVCGYNYGDYSDVMLQGNAEYYWGYQNADKNTLNWHNPSAANDAFSTGDRWRVQYIVKPFESIQVVITTFEGTQVSSEDYVVAWENLKFASEATESTVFKPYFMFVNVKVELSNIYIGYDLEGDIGELNSAVADCSKEIDFTLYTDESVKQYEEALEEAKTVQTNCANMINLPYTKSEINKATSKLVNASKMLIPRTLEFKVGGSESKTSESVCEAAADEPLPTDVTIDGSKYIIRWTLDGKVVTTYDSSRTIEDYVAEFVDSKMLEVKYQQGDVVDGKRDMRYIASVNGLDYEKAGFVFSRANENPTITGDKCVYRETTKVYKSLMADGASTSISGAGYDDYSQYMYAFIIRKTPVDYTLYVRAYVVLPESGKIVYGAVRTITPENPDTVSASQNKEITDLFHDQGYDYMTPEEPAAGEEVTLRLRTERNNVTDAYVMYNTGTETNVADKTEATLLVKNMGGSSSHKYGYISLFDSSCPFNKDDIWVIEMDVTVSNYASSQGTARVGLKLYDLKTLNSSAYLITTFINGGRPHYTTGTNTYQEVSAASDMYLPNGGTWHFRYTIIEDKTLRTEVINESGVLVVDYTVNLSDTGYDGSQTFLPQLYLSAADYELENIRVYEYASTQMKLEKRSDYYDTWECEITVPNQEMNYWFIAENSTDTNMTYYNLSNTEKVIVEDSSAGNSFGDCFRIIPGQTTPDWAKGALWYSIMPDAFYNGNTTNDKQISGENNYTTWNKLHKNLTDKYGGDLQGIEEKLDYVEELSVDAIYMNPISKSYQNAGYGSVRYDEIESSFGNEANLVSLANAIHDKDMKLIGDVVLYFTAENSYYFNKDGRWPEVGAYNNPTSEWSGLYKFTNEDNTEYLQTIWDGTPGVNLSSTEAKELLYGNKDSSLMRYATLFDGYRFDCGGWLWGEDEDGNEIPRDEVVREIKSSLQTVNEDFLMLTESDSSNLDNDSWDSEWNLAYNEKLADYAKGTLEADKLVEAMYQYEMLYPRNVALCLQNMLCTHDTERIAQDLDYMYNPAVLVQMTYLGAPSIYYGEEVELLKQNESNLGSVREGTDTIYTQSFYAMDWDESNWNWERLNFYKAIGELRSTYSCVKTGVVKMLSDGSDGTIMFGRWDAQGAAVTVACQNEEAITVEIPVKSLDVKDGTVMTDWFTGVQYVVKGGYITAEIAPGGTVIVTGVKASSYCEKYEVTAIGDVTVGDSILTDNTAILESGTTLNVSGKGEICDTVDKIAFANTVAYHDFAVSATLSGNGAFMVRNGLDADDMYYSAVIADGKLSVLARTTQGAAVKVLVTDIECTGTVKLARTGENKFITYIDGVEVADSAIFIGMNNQVYYGFASTSETASEMSVSNISYVQLGNEITYDTFDGTVNTTLLDNVNADFVSVSNGKLTIKNTGDESRYLLTNSMDHDWTFKSSMNYSPASEGAYAGVICRQDTDNYVVAGRMMKDGTSVLFLGKATDGTMEVYSSVSDPGGEVIIQLQRIGAYYSAVYSVDDGVTWNYIGKFYTNYSNERVGIVVEDAGVATFDWVSFGDSINDGKSVNTPYSPVKVDLTYTNDTTAMEAEYQYRGGTWSMVAEGLAQTTCSWDYTQALVTNKVYSGLYAEATIRILDAENGGFAGISFGKTSLDDGPTKGFHLRYFPNGYLQLISGEADILATSQLDVPEDGVMRLVLMAFDGRIMVYAGQEEELVISLENTHYESGYTSLFTQGASAEFQNFHHGSTNASWNWVSGYGTGGGNGLCTIDTSYIPEVTSTKLQIPTIATLTGYAFTDFVLTGRIMVSKTDETLDCKSGFLICASEGVPEIEDGVYVYLDGNGNLKLSVEGVVKDTCSVGTDTEIVKIMIVKQNGAYNVFVNGATSPALTYTEAFNRGGVLTVYTQNGNGFFAGLAIENLQPGQESSTSSIYSKWNSEGIVTSEYNDDFDTADSINNYLLYNTTQATFEVKDGMLSCTSSNNWHAGATVMNDVYGDFEMEFTLSFEESEVEGSWMAIGMHKANPNGDHNSFGLSFLIDQEWGVQVFQGAVDETEEAKVVYGRTQINNYNETGTKIKIRVEGNTYTIYADDTEVLSYTDTEDYFSKGFISFSSGMQEFSIDNLRISD